MNYAAYEGGQDRHLAFPTMLPSQWKMVNIFPNITFNIRGSALRLDVAIPLSANKVMITYRGLGLKSDTTQQRRERIRDYNSIWGSLGRNLHEDLLAVMGQGRVLGSGQPYLLHAREEGNRIHDEVGLRHYYAEWGRRMGHLPSAAAESAASAHG